MYIIAKFCTRHPNRSQTPHLSGGAVFAFYFPHQAGIEAAYAQHWHKSILSLAVCIIRARVHNIQAVPCRFSCLNQSG